MSCRPIRSGWWLPLALCALDLPARADRLVTKDGRVLSPRKARELEQGYRLEFENGEVVLPNRDLVQSVEIEGDMSEYVPKNEDEKAKLAQGYVKYQGKWLSKPAYEETLRKEYEKSRARTEALAQHAEWRNAWTKPTSHFVVKTNTSPELLDYYAELMEAYYALMDERIGIEPTPTMRRTKMTVNIYKSRREFLDLSNADNPAAAGYFFSGDNTLNFYHEYSDPAQTSWVALHECTHLLTYLVDQQYQPQIWLNEAVADYFGSSKITRDKKGKLVIQPGELQTDRVLTVQQAIKNGAGTRTASPEKTPASGTKNRPDTKLVELFALSRDEFDAFQYAHAWSFVYFLNNFENAKYRNAFNKFFKGLYTLEKGLPIEVTNSWAGGTGTGKSVPPAAIRDYLLKKLGIKDLVQLERDWKAYISAIPIEGSDALLKRGLYAFREERFEDALADLNAAIEAGTADPRAWWTRARCRALDEKIPEAVQDLEMAVSIDPLNARFRCELSFLLTAPEKVTLKSFGSAMFGEEGDLKPIENKPEAKRQAGLAMELDPENDRYREWFERFQ